MINGLLCINKPLGIYSVDITNYLKKVIAGNLSKTNIDNFCLFKTNQDKPIYDKVDHDIFKKSYKNIKIGHGGTLDAYAEGVLSNISIKFLVVGIGTGTKLMPSFLNCDKVTIYIYILGL